MTHFSGRTPQFPVGWLLVSKTGRVGQILAIRPDRVTVRLQDGTYRGIPHHAIVGVFRPPASRDNFDIEFERRVQEAWT
jgi:hypothetical protein